MSNVVLGWLNLVVLAITCVIVTWYAIETARLRKAAQLQTELQTGPFLSIGRAGSKFFVHNAGNGLARNISIEDVHFDPPHYCLRAEPITHLGPGKDVFPTWLVVTQVFQGDPPEEIPDTDLADRALARYTTTFALNYKSIVGRTDKTVLAVEAGRVEIVSDCRAA